MFPQHDSIDELALPTYSAFSLDVRAALQQPFAPHEVQLRAGKRRARDDGGWECIAIPVLARRSIEDRLDTLVPGEWETTSPSLVVADRRIVVCARVTIGTITHTDYGEIFLDRPAVPDEVEELLWSVPDTFDHAFQRACARFGLGRYLDDLAREWLPYDAERACIALSPEQQHAHLLKLYQQAGLPRPQEIAQPACDEREPTPTSLSAMREGIRARDLAWVRQQCAAHPRSLQRILTRWQVPRLDDLSDLQLAEVMNSIHSSQARAAQFLSSAS